MTTVNERLRTRLLRRAALNTRLENATVADVMAIWRRVVATILASVSGHTDLFTKERAFLGVPAADRLSRLHSSLIGPLRSALGTAMAEMARPIVRDLSTFARRELMEVPDLLQGEIDRALATAPLAEAALAKPAFDDADPMTGARVGVMFDSVPAQQIAVMLSTPAGGSFFQTGLERLGQQLFSQARTALIVGLMQGQGTAKVARALQGILGGARWQAERIVRSEYVRIGNQANLLTFERNKRLLMGVQWHSALDFRVCQQCGALDGKVWKDVAKAPIPVQSTHASCRCILSPLVKYFKALNLPPGTRASFDGQIPATVTYRDWFPQQDAAFQRAALGPTRYKLWKAGAAKLGDFATAFGVKPVSALPSAIGKGR